MVAVPVMVVVVGVVAAAVVARGGAPVPMVPVAADPAAAVPVPADPAVARARADTPVAEDPDTRGDVARHPDVTGADDVGPPVAAVVVAVGVVAVDPVVAAARHDAPVARPPVAVPADVAGHPGVARADRHRVPVAVDPDAAVIVAGRPAVAGSDHAAVVAVDPAAVVSVAPHVGVAIVGRLDGLPVAGDRDPVLVEVGVDPLEAVPIGLAVEPFDPGPVRVVVAFDPDPPLVVDGWYVRGLRGGRGRCNQGGRCERAEQDGLQSHGAAPGKRVEHWLRR